MWIKKMLTIKWQKKNGWSGLKPDLKIIKKKQQNEMLTKNNG